MSALNAGVSPSASTETPAAVLTPSDESAAKVSAALTAIIQLMPVWEPKHPETEQFVKRFSTFSDDVISSVIGAVESNPELASINKFNVNKARRGLQYLTAFRTIIDQTEEFLINFRFTYFSVKAREVADALQMYEIAKGIGRDPSSAGVAAHAKMIKRDLRRPRVKKATKAPAPADAPKPV
ncbi:MAG TPA: hypothetical protein VGQ46_00915 [Thermoanaerobaculia bacterium]|jgi:hypothetical protein|nr:hypothetical protein [Thermoanaerobaculia bacterium]